MLSAPNTLGIIYISVREMNFIMMNVRRPYTIKLFNDIRHYIRQMTAPSFRLFTAVGWPEVM